MHICLSKIFSLLRRGKRSKYVLDGYGMENTSYAEGFSVSRSCDSYAQQNFYISVNRTDDGYTANGTLLDNDGTEYSTEESIALSKKACRAIEELHPERLTDVAVPTGIEENDESEEIEEIIILDAPIIKIEVVYADGSIHEKVDEDGFSMKVYQIVLPCFRSKLK